MITLALDTTGSWCSCAIVNGHKVLSNPSERIGRGHAERLAPMVQEALAGADVSARHIERIAVCTGPGSFTGLRVALAFARSFALPRSIPVIGVSALMAMAMEADPDSSKFVVSSINAKRGDLCWAAFENGIEIIAPKTQKVEIATAEIAQIPADLYVGDGVELLGQTPNTIDHVSPAILGWMADSMDPGVFPPEPFYARGPDAKLPGGKSLA